MGKLKVNSFLVISLQPYINWQHIEKEIKEMPKGVFNFCLQEEIRKESIRHAEKDPFFKGIHQGELRIVDLLIEVFNIRSKMWWLQKDPQMMDKIKLHHIWSTRRQHHTKPHFMRRNGTLSFCQLKDFD